MQEIQENSSSTVTLAPTAAPGSVSQHCVDLIPLQESVPHHARSRTANDVADVDATIEFVRDYINTQQIEILFDGTLFLRGRPLQATMPDEVDAVLAVDAPSVSDLLDELYFFAKNSGFRAKKVELSAALRQLLRSEKRRRYQAIMGPLISGDVSSRAQAEEQWDRLGTLFDMDRKLAVAVLQHFCWSVKQKQLGRPVVHHCMPIIFSAEQGTGKTVFAKKFLSPLRELATDSALFSDLADRRSGDIFRFPVILLDDMEQIPSSMVPVLKSVLTSDRLRRRRLGTSLSDGIRQCSVPIGTSNQMVHELVEDGTGHRRFVMLPFRNGAIAKGGDADIWQIVNSTDYEMLWRAVDAFAPSPLLPHLEKLRDHQGAGSNKGGVLEWVRGLDLDSEPVRNLTTKRGIRAQGLHALFMAQTGIDLSPKRFSDEMNRCALRPDTPFADKIKIETGWLYRPKGTLSDARDQKRQAPLAQRSAPSSASLLGPSASSAPSRVLSADEGIE
ncbi:virulence-associated E family protein [Bradyrhizobium quebecense]|uniref:Virulence-associated protein E-like domain-containing protein n=1 Tax=Bradyrhizobium quebecense TaxID=2748629 RepID=A0A973WV92_9BRAD|nr:primase-helicase family protein [Bradyrhizobium quebecense]UGA43017.1 virulence-associated E family protein [Bradyrhizobium quebecense]